MGSTEYDHILAEAQKLPRDEQLKLIEDLGSGLGTETGPAAENLRHRLFQAMQGELESGAHKSETGQEKTRSIMELQGLGKDIWRDVDVEEYIKRERDSWNCSG